MQTRKKAAESVQSIINESGMLAIDGIMISKMTMLELEELRKYVEELPEEQQRQFYRNVERNYPEELRQIENEYNLMVNEVQ